jgi:hypothetical protein
VSPLDNALIAGIKYRSKKRTNRALAAKPPGSTLSHTEIESLHLAAMQDALPTAPGFFRKCGLTAAAGEPILSLEERMPRQVTMTTRLPFGDLPAGVEPSNMSGFSGAERALELPPRPLPSRDSLGLDQRLFVRSGYGLVLVMLDCAAAGDDLALSLALCSVLRESASLVLTDRAALLPLADALLRQSPKLGALRGSKTATPSSVAAAAAADWKRRICVFARMPSKDDSPSGIVSHIR